MFNNDLSTTPSFYLAEVDPVHKGKAFIINLYDPGEIGIENARLVIEKPNPTCAEVAAADTCLLSVFDNPTDTTPSSGPTPYSPCSILTTNEFTEGAFDGKLLQIEVALGTDYTCATCWWKVRYDLGTNPSGSANDTTTWSAAIKGDPVHLINE